MIYPSPSRYFLGSNSSRGFYSLYDGFCPPENDCFLNVIKGGPGCGKSSFMRRIGSHAESKGLTVEYVLCSGDPDSLDGVFIPELGIAYVDGTSPHRIDPPFPGSAGAYLDLGRFYDSHALEKHREEIVSLNSSYKSLYTAAYSYLSAAAAVHQRRYPGIWSDADRDKVRKKAQAFAAREFKKDGTAQCYIRKIFLSAICCKGRVFLHDGCCERLCILDNELGMGNFYLETLLPLAQIKGYSIIVCPDCLEPERISAIIIPELSLALCCSDALPSDTLECYRHIRLDSVASREKLTRLRPELRRAKKLSRECVSIATDTLSQAKALHDCLEQVYNPCVDFDGVYGEAEKHINKLLRGI
ncbi:MAG: hypothetical protein E7420_07005 [Ruminococcaceae bacterium]|nr:hypothetical protein [Oscillospiraceae bacterium]